MPQTMDRRSRAVILLVGYSSRSLLHFVNAPARSDTCAEGNFTGREYIAPVGRRKPIAISTA